MRCEDNFFCRKKTDKKQKRVLKNKFREHLFKYSIFYIFLQVITSTLVDSNRENE